LGAQIQDDAFHEIQLNGKQLVFLFMAATVVSVVIFLCGVLVGRGVRAERTATISEAPALTSAVRTGDVPSAPAAIAPAAAPAGSDPTAAAPPPAVDDLSYVNRLEKPTPPAEDLKPSPKTLPAPAVVPAASAVKPTTGKAASKSAKSASKEPGSAGSVDAAVTPKSPEPGPSSYTVQVAALNVKGEAEAVAKRLTAKGYAAYVSAPQNGAPSVYRVRVGRYGSRREAETIATKLQKEEQFQPWITR
jgi:cell division septation protein DedD